MKYKYIIILILSILVYLPEVRADTYYDWEKIELGELPTASEETLSKVYQVSGKYYITEKQDANYTPIPLNENLNGKTIYFKDLTSYLNDFDYSIRNSFVYAYDSNNNRYFYQLTDIFGHNDLVISKLCYHDSNLFKDPVFYYRSDIDGLYKYTSSYLVDKDCFITSFNNTDVSIYSYYSLTPFDITYTWKEVQESDVIEVVISKEDFYLFFTFEDIQGFNILSSYDLNSFNDFQRIVTVLGFNSFFLGFVGFCVYIIIKLINKGISLIFK